MRIRKILFIAVWLLFLSLGATAQIFTANKYLGFIASDWKGDVAPKLFEVFVQKSPLAPTPSFTNEAGKPLNGRLHIIIHSQKYVIADISKGKIHGELRLFVYNEETERYNLKEGVYDGKQHHYSSRETYTYAQGIVTHYISYHPNDQLHKEINYINGKIHGDVIEYNTQGKMVGKQSYWHGILHGEKMETGARGHITKATYENGVLQGAYKEFFANGLAAVEGQYAENKKTGRWLVFEKNGDLKEDVTYLAGKRHGETKRYQKGALYEYSEYAYDKRHGKHLYYRGIPPAMRLSLEEEYSEGKLDGTAKRFNERNILFFEANYSKGAKNSSKDFHPTTGLIMTETLYQNGRAIAERDYDKKGILRYLRLPDEKGYMVVVKEYNQQGQVTKTNKTYKRTANIELVEDEWGIIDLPN